MTDPAKAGERGKPKLTTAQEKMLERVVKTNGGGVNGYSLTAREIATAYELHDLELVQGKAGNLSRIVHTKEGLALWRSIWPAIAERRAKRAPLPAARDAAMKEGG